jgi:RNA polymerase sigma-54 factor
MLRLEHQVVQRQEQRLILTQQQILGLNLLQMNNLELEEYLAAEVEQNPLLELVPPDDGLPPVTAHAEQDANDASFAEEVEANILTRNGESADLNRTRERELPDEFMDLDGAADDRYREGRDLSINPDLFGTWEYRMDSVTGEESLQAHLFGQLRATVDDPEDLLAGEAVILALDNDGYFRGNLQELAAEVSADAERLERMLSVIKTFDPSGVGAADLRECLLLQIDAEFPGDKELRLLVSAHLEDLGNRRIPLIARALRISERKAEVLAERVSMLEPRPGRRFSTGPSLAVTPEVIIQEVPEERRVEGAPRFEAVPASDRQFHVRWDDEYVRYLDKSADREVRSFLEEKRRSAEALLKNLTRREQTLIKAAEVIAETQEEFLEKGEMFLKPLRLKDIAERVGAHESTMSRAVSGKFIQTPQGVIEMKRFFSTGLATADGEGQSARSVQAQIRQMIEGEDKRKPLSDQTIADRLRKQGLEIARRTVAKYREEMDIPTSGRRRHFGH